MTDLIDSADLIPEAVSAGGAVAPLKAERIQLIFILSGGTNRPYDFARESAEEREARLTAGWRKRTVDDPWKPRAIREAA